MPEVVAESVPETPPVTQSGKNPVLTGWKPMNFFKRIVTTFWEGVNSGPIFPDVLYPNTPFPPFVIAFVFFCFVTAVLLTAKANALRLARRVTGSFDEMCDNCNASC